MGIFLKQFFSVFYVVFNLEIFVLINLYWIFSIISHLKYFESKLDRSM